MSVTDANAFGELSAFLARDPDNLSLLADSAQAAHDARRWEDAAALIERHRTLAPLPTELRHLEGLNAMARQDWDGATTIYGALFEEGHDSPPIRFNFAWSLAMAKHGADALPLLDDATVEAIPQAAQLLVGLLHESGDLDEAAERARQLLERHPDHRGLNATVSTLAIDIEDIALARQTAERAGDHPDAQVTLATLMLSEDQREEAARTFDRVRTANPASPRAWVGHGLATLEANPRVAAQDLDHGASLFGTHLGSWLAAGWAHFIAGDAAAARDRFETALAIDDTFAEAHGSLAVVALMSGDLNDARRRADIARRLDRESFAGALAASLIAASEGDATKAERIVALALQVPVDAEGHTIAQALARRGVRG